ncbi:MAG: hypothetical protein IPF53_11660 [Blastocatellia bacterium]|nr:hypothetical protein [Blastocatellia bacterium]
MKVRRHIWAGDTPALSFLPHVPVLRMSLKRFCLVDRIAAFTLAGLMLALHVDFPALAVLTGFVSAIAYWGVETRLSADPCRGTVENPARGGHHSPHR